MPFAMPRWGWFAIGGVLLLALFYMTLHAYGASRYKAGKQDADAAWIAASNKLVEKAQNAGTKASAAAAVRAADFAAQQEAEKKAIEEANRNDTSPLDALWGAGNSSK